VEINMRKIFLLVTLLILFEFLTLVDPNSSKSPKKTTSPTTSTSHSSSPSSSSTNSVDFSESWINNTIDDYHLWEWSSKELMTSPNPFMDASSASIETKIYVVGGKNPDAGGEGHLRQLLIYDAIEDSWRSGPNLPSIYPAVENPAVIEYNGEIYVFGGQTSPFSGAVNKAAKFSTSFGKWTMLANMPTARGGNGAVVVNDLIYVVGGMTSAGTSLKTVEIFDPKTGNWSSSTNLTIARDNAGVIAIDDKIYAIGGRTRFVNEVLSSVEVFDPSTETWTILHTQMPTARRSVLALSVDVLVLVMGGESQDKVFASNEMYDVSSNTWYILPPLPEARHGPCGDIIGNQLFLVGGSLHKGEYPTDLVNLFLL